MAGLPGEAPAHGQGAGLLTSYPLQSGRPRPPDAANSFPLRWPGWHVREGAPCVLSGFGTLVVE
jgi:hypothetical protein